MGAVTSASGIVFEMLNDIAEAALNENIGPMLMSCRMIRPR